MARFLCQIPSLYIHCLSSLLVLGFCIYHLFLWSDFNFLHNFQWIPLSTQLCLVSYSFLRYYCFLIESFSRQLHLMVFHRSLEWQQVSSSFQGSSQYSGRSQLCCSLDALACPLFSKSLSSCINLFYDYYYHYYYYWNFRQQFWQVVFTGVIVTASCLRSPGSFEVLYSSNFDVVWFLPLVSISPNLLFWDLSKCTNYHRYHCPYPWYGYAKRT